MELVIDVIYDVVYYLIKERYYGSDKVTKKEKLLKKLKNNPRTVKFKEIDKILKDIGFERRQPAKGSSHYT